LLDFSYPDNSNQIQAGEIIKKTVEAGKQRDSQSCLSVGSRRRSTHKQKANEDRQRHYIVRQKKVDADFMLHSGFRLGIVESQKKKGFVEKRFASRRDGEIWG
jgi:hypothetical protein